MQRIGKQVCLESSVLDRRLDRDGSAAAAPRMTDGPFQHNLPLPADHHAHAWLQTSSIKAFYAVPDCLNVVACHADIVWADF